MDLIKALLGNAELQTAILSLFGLFLTYVIARVAAAFTALTGIQIEARQREALHEAIQSGVASAYKFGPDVAMATVKAHVIQYLRESVPGALKALTPGDGVLDTLIERYALAILNKYGEPK